MYIDANEALSLRIDDNTGDMFALGWNRAIAKVTTELPTADVAPVRHAHWIFQKGVFANNGTKGCFECSACRAVIDTETFALMDECGQTRGCGSCGARMDEEASSND